MDTEYRKPPVIERVVSLYADIPEELFERKFEQWKNLVAVSYPVYEPLKQWNLNFEQKGDPKEPIPTLGSSGPELIITPRFSRKHSREGFDWSIRCPRGQFTMNMHPDPVNGSGRRFAHLRHEFLSWLEQWATHFQITKCNLLQVIYVNAIDPNTVKPFYSTDGNNLQLGQVINLFHNITRDKETMVPPVACIVNVGFPDRDDAILTLQVQDVPSPTGTPAVNVNFIVNIQLNGERPSMDKIRELLDWAHERIIERFDLSFSPQAKAHFQPLTK